MHNLKTLALIGALTSTVAITGCSGGSGGSSDSQTDDTSGTTISGSASAPAGAVAYLEPASPFDIALSFIISPVAAAITGLEPVGGATVELIRVDDDGNQIGDVLAESVTSTTGDYELILPQGVNLAGNLIVRITGTNNAQMRAQVVEQAVDISPVSEFVLRKFIEQGTDLDQLVATDVVKLGGKVEEFDLTAGANLDEMLAVLEAEVGELVESEIAVISADPGDISTIAGAYANSAFGISMDDSNSSGFGTLFGEIWAAQIELSDGGDGTVSITLGTEDLADAGLNGSTVDSSGLWYFVGSETLNETFPATFTNSGILSIEGEFEEEIYDDHPDLGQRRPPLTFNFQQVSDKGLFFLLSQEAAVEYGTVDTDGDGNKDALDPNDPRGDEVNRALEVLARKPSNMTAADLNGNFGRVYISSNLEMLGPVTLATETNTLSFNGDGTFEYNAGSGHELLLSDTGTAYSAPEVIAESNLSITVSSDGDITAAGGSASDGFVNDTFDFIAFAESDGQSDNFADFEKTLMVKLPTNGVSVSGKTYRVMLMSMYMDGASNGTSEFELFATQFNSFITMDSETAGSFGGKISAVAKQGLGGNLEGTREEVTGDITAAIANNGAATIELNDGSGDGVNVLEGFFNEDASLGVFTEHWQPSDSSDPDELGIAVLIEVTR
ncbi:hypothetical protein [uncultured Marinobacter sp.]|uniref:hypothetical protein n=1 Tax=uncultured Marinobacter sp. TaxID=187379 RepID=UPI00261A3394|nr:hypothetical protein [uncultured Marinobacter sp.]